VPVHIDNKGNKYSGHEELFVSGASVEQLLCLYMYIYLSYMSGFFQKSKLLCGNGSISFTLLVYLSIYL
jgi:hypothetical protein